MKSSASFFVACGIALAGSAALLALHPQGWQPFAWSFGGLLALLNACAGMNINRRAIGMDSTHFLLWGMGAHLLRAMSLILILAVSNRFAWPESGALITCTLFGYFAFLFHEVLSLHFTSMAAHLRGSLAIGAS